SDHQAAIECLKHAIRLSPLDASAWIAHVGIAYASFFLGDYVEGIRHAAVALRDQPNNLPTLRVAMANHALSGNLEIARKFWQQVVHLSPSVRISKITAIALWRERDKEKLREAYRLVGMPE